MIVNESNLWVYFRYSGIDIFFTLTKFFCWFFFDNFWKFFQDDALFIIVSSENFFHIQMISNVNSQAPKTIWTQGGRCAWSCTNGQAMVRFLKPQISIYLCQKLFWTLRKIQIRFDFYWKSWKSLWRVT